MITLDTIGNNAFTLDLLPVANCEQFIFIFVNTFSNSNKIVYLEPQPTSRTFYFDITVTNDPLLSDPENGVIYLNEDGQYFYNVYEVPVGDVVDNTYLAAFLLAKQTELEIITSDLCALRTGRLLVKDIE